MERTNLILRSFKSINQVLIVLSSVTPGWRTALSVSSPDDSDD